MTDKRKIDRGHEVLYEKQGDCETEHSQNGQEKRDRIRNLGRTFR